MKIIKYLFKALKILIYIAILLIVSVILMQRVFNNKVSIGGYRIFTVISESMIPEYNIFDVIISKEVDTNTIKINDDVVYLGLEDDFKDKIVTHRVINIDKEKKTLTTRGIANTKDDPEIPMKQVYGKVIFKSTILSLISKLVNNSVGFYFIIIVPLALLLVSEFIDFKKKNEKEN